MRSYLMFGLGIHSEVPLPDVPFFSGDPDVYIRYGTVSWEAAAEQPEEGHRVVNRFKSDFFDAELLFDIHDGKVITVQPKGEIELKVLQAWLIGQLMPTLLRQRGYVVLHGSAVAKEGTAIAFLGESGWGKSTLAEFFVQHGYDFLTDDMLVIDMERESLSVLPGPQYIRLNPDVGAKLVSDFDDLPLVSERVSKRIHSVRRAAETAMPLGKVYILDNVPAPENRVEAIDGRPALLHLLMHTRAQKLLTEPVFLSRQLEQCTNLLQRVPISKLHRIRSIDALADLKETIEQDLDGIFAAHVR